jgi:hypothetical protein
MAIATAAPPTSFASNLIGNVSISTPSVVIRGTREKPISAIGLTPSRQMRSGFSTEHQRTHNSEEVVWKADSPPYQPATGLPDRCCGVVAPQKRRAQSQLVETVA